MASRLIEAFTVESDGGEQRVVACRERSIDASGLNSNESVWSGVSYFEFEDNGEIAYLQSDGTFQDGYGKRLPPRQLTPRHSVGLEHLQ